jgi:hypothetical protein
MKPLAPVYRFVIGFLLALFIAAVLVIAIDRKSNPTTLQDVAVQHVADSVNSRWTAKLRAHEDSIQRLLAQRDSVWNIAYTDKKEEANKYKKIADRTTAQYNDLKIKYAQPCAEVIEACDQRERERLSQIQAQETALIIADNRLTNCRANSASLNREIALADSLLKSKNQTITTQRDYITGVTNRSDRSWLFRNWRWTFGKWREYVLQK